MNQSVFDVNGQLQSIESKIVVALERVSEAFRVLLWEEAKEHTLSPIQVQLLIFCAFHTEEKRKVGFLACEFNLTKATISDAVKTLEQKGYIKKETEAADTRSYCIHLTKNGLALAKKISGFATPVYDSVKELTENQQQVLFGSLMELIQKLQVANIISINRMCLSCRFYEKKSAGHYCRFLKTALKNTELRIDCNEYEIAN